MACLYADKCDGVCSMATNNDGEYDPEQKQGGCDDKGVCVVGDDPEPSRNCENYESDWSCYECGADLNNEECECDD